MFQLAFCIDLQLFIITKTPVISIILKINMYIKTVPNTEYQKFKKFRHYNFIFINKLLLNVFSEAIIF